MPTRLLNCSVSLEYLRVSFPLFGLVALWMITSLIPLDVWSLKDALTGLWSLLVTSSIDVKYSGAKFDSNPFHER